MKVPCLVWLQGPWSPVGYDVVELLDEVAPAPLPAPGNCPLDGREIPEMPWSPLGYRVVESAPPPSPALRRRPTKAARAVKGGPPRQRRRLGRWAVIAAGGSCLTAVALVVVMFRLPAQEVKAPSAPAVALEDVWPADRQGSDRETFGTAVEFVRNAKEAGRVADKEHKLTFLLHVSGNFEDSGFT